MANGKLVTVEKGIKKREDGKYVVSLDYGREWKENKKTGVRELKQVKTTKVCNTLKEAKALKGKNDSEKLFKKKTGRTNKITIEAAIEDYMEHGRADWGDGYYKQKKAQNKRLIAYFGDREVRSINTIDIEDFFKWNMQVHPSFPRPYTLHSVRKMKSHTGDIWEFMIKSQSKYGITTNVVKAAKHGKVPKYKSVSWSIEELNRFLETVFKNETDYSSFTLLGLGALSGLRRQCIAGLRWGDVDWKNRVLHVSNARVEGDEESWVEKLPKTNTARIAALPNCLAEMLKLVKEQQEELLEREVGPEDYVYMSRTNLLNNYLPTPKKVTRRWMELQTRINRILTDSGKENVPIIRLHDLRHTNASICLNSNEVSFLQVAANLGHVVKDTTTTRIYWHDDGKRDEINDYIDKIITVKIKAYS